MTKELEEIMKKAYETGALTDTEFRKAITDLFLEEDEYIIDTGNFENVNAEFVLRLKGKHRKLHKIFWNDKFAQEPKQYLKWEDLDKFEEQKDFFGLLNGNKYTLWWYRDSRNKYVMINLNEINIVTLCDMFKQDIDFFNDLHLERVEE